MTDDMSVAVLLGRILDDAMNHTVSDVHLHCASSSLHVQYRREGRLEDYLRISESGQRIARRIKALAHMDVVETRMPQDGSFTWESETKICDVRVAVLPVIDGEAVVLRLLTKMKASPSFSDLGMTPGQTANLQEILRLGHGMVLVAGPTGAGKTTTLYTMMTYLAQLKRNVISIEDPVEMPLLDCRQMEVRERIGVTFDLGLKSILRQDPDVIMIGEIRDEATARTALRAALTGRLVLSTTHAHDMVGAAARLVDFGLSRSLVGDVLKAVIIQHRQDYRSDKRAFDVQWITERFIQLLASSLSWGELRAQADYARGTLLPVWSS